MPLLFQTNPSLPLPVKNNGCLWLSLLYIIEKYTDLEFTLEGIVKDAEFLQARNVISRDPGNEYFPIYPQKFLDYYTPGKFSYKGIISLAYEFKPTDLSIQFWKRRDANIKHFSVGREQVEYDPGEDSSTIREGDLVSFRLIERNEK
jgi:hypothetical protein